MNKIQRYIRIEKTILLCVFTVVLLIDLYCAFFYGIYILNIIVFIFDIVVLLIGFYPIMGKYCCWIEIRGAEIYLLNFKGEILRFFTGDIIKVVYGFMKYKLYFWQDGKELVVQCHPGVRVYKNGKSIEVFL